MNSFIKKKIKEHGFWLLLWETVMVLGAIIGSTILAMNVDISKWGYAFFLLSSSAGIYVGVYRHVISLTMLNVFFTIVNGVGVYRWLF
jgi:hypothetical protein